MTASEHILVIKLGALGDFIQALGPMRAIRQHHPDAHITLLTTQPLVSFAEESGYFDSVWIDEKPRWHQPLKWLKLRQKLNQQGFAWVYDLQNNDRTNLYFKLFSVKPNWSGTAKGASHRNIDPARTQGHALDGHIQTLAKAGIGGVSLDDLSWIKADISEFNLVKPYILLLPGSAPSRLDKRWPAENYAALADRLKDDGYHSVLIGTDAEAEVAGRIKSESSHVIDLTGRTSLHQIIVLGRHAAGCIGNDTGPMHMVAATGCPSLALFSDASNPARHYPKGENADIIYKPDLGAITVEDVQAKFRIMAP